MDSTLHSKLQQAAKQGRLDCIEMAHTYSSLGGHLGGAFSMMELLVTLYQTKLKYDVSNPNDEKRDRFILSKGHGAIGLYAVLKQVGFINDELLRTFRADGTELGVHPHMNTKLGIEYTTGSMGQGLSLGVGTALALKRKNNTSSKVYVMLGDGECNEGSVWESAISAVHYHLDNLVAIVDRNHLQLGGPTIAVMSMETLPEIWSSIGWKTICIDGHDFNQISTALNNTQNSPLVIIADTIKGKGVSFMENNPKWHNSVLSDSLYEQAIKEILEND